MIRRVRYTPNTEMHLCKMHVVRRYAFLIYINATALYFLSIFHAALCSGSIHVFVCMSTLLHSRPVFVFIIFLFHSRSDGAAFSSGQDRQHRGDCHSNHSFVDRAIKHRGILESKTFEDLISLNLISILHNLHSLRNTHGFFLAEQVMVEARLCCWLSSESPLSRHRGGKKYTEKES